jgi:isopenicillin N synthase-like dioxygenase
MAKYSPPIIDIRGDRHTVITQIDEACRSWGVFVVVGHGLDHALLEAVLSNGHRFFDLPLDTKQQYNLTLNGTRWRGYMPLGGENSVSGTVVDYKEGLYLGDEHLPNDPRVLARVPTFGANVLPDNEIPEMRETMSRYLQGMRGLGDRMMDFLSLAMHWMSRTCGPT